MASPKSPPRVPADLAPDPEATYNPAHTATPGARTVLPTEPAIPAGARSSTVDVRSTTPEPGAVPPVATDGEAFELRERLAQGGFGDVWTGIQPSLDRLVALKRLREDRLEGSSAGDRVAMQEMFRHEALITARLEHPNIVPVYQLGTDDAGQAMLAMKLVRGRPWADLIRDDLALPVDELLSRHLPILIDVAQAVAYAHSRGILHRDLKPQQVMVGEFGEVLLMDWGLALPFGDDGAVLVPATAGDDPAPTGSGDSTAATVPTAAPRVAGTPSFMAPEQTRGEPAEIGPWTDLYLLGGTLYYLVTGTPPHQANGSVAAFVRASRGEIEPPAERAPGRRIPAELERLVLGVLEAEAGDRRPATVQGFITALEAYLSGASRKRRSRELVDGVRRRQAIDGDYSELGQRLSKLQEAQALWPENPDAGELRYEALQGYAETALAKGDLALARLQAGQLAAGAGRDELLARVERSLARRRSVARQRRLALAALAVAAVALIGGAFLFARDQRQAAERLAVERDAARAARADATSLMTFMLEDLWENLAQIERVDILAPIARRADAYYSERDVVSLSAAEAANRGSAFITIGETLGYQGDVEGAAAAFAKAAAVFRALAGDTGDDPDLRLRYLDALELLGRAQSDLGDKQAALETFGEHRRRCENALAEHAGELELELALATGIDATGIVLYDLGEIERAKEVFAQALELAEKTRSRSPGAGLAGLLSGIEMRLAITRSELGELEPALASIDRSIALAEESIRVNPAQSRFDADMLQATRAEILSQLGRPEEAAAIVRASLLEVRRAVDEDPANAERRYVLALLELGLAKIESRLGRRTEAEAAWRRVVDAVEPLRETTDHSYLLDSLVRALLHLGRVEEAAPVAGRLLAKGWSHQGFRELCHRHGIGVAG